VAQYPVADNIRTRDNARKGAKSSRSGTEAARDTPPTRGVSKTVDKVVHRRSTSPELIQPAKGMRRVAQLVPKSTFAVPQMALEVPRIPPQAPARVTPRIPSRTTSRDLIAIRALPVCRAAARQTALQAVVSPGTQIIGDAAMAVAVGTVTRGAKIGRS
jgi:hypothetical protein